MNHHCRLCVLVVAAMLLGPAAARATVYYVDFDGGSDTANGQSPATAFKHCPGDDSATGVARSTTLAAGDTVIFKGDVRYRSILDCDFSGTAASPITYDGNTAGTFGTGRAIIDGSEPLAGWTQCQSAADCGGNPNWQNIYYAYAPAAASNAGLANLYEDGHMCWMAQDPNQPDPFFMDSISNFYNVPVGAMTTTSLTDPVRLTQTDPNHWNGAYVMVWVQPNVVRYRRILSFDPAQDRITYEATGTPYTDRDGLYAIYNSIHLLDTPGEYVLNETAEPNGTHKVFLWPQTPGDISQKEITVSVRSVGIDLGARSYVTIQGFRVQKQSGAELHDGIGIKSLDWSISPRGLIIRDNEIRGIRHHPERGYGAVYIYNGRDCLIEDNRVEELPVNIGFLLGGGQNMTVRNNYLRKCGSQTIWFMGVQGGSCTDNEVRDGRGTHANGISVYQGSSDVVVARNRIFDSNISITVEASTNVTLAYNYCINPDFYVVADWGNTTNLIVHNNTLIRNEDLPSLTISGSSSAEVRNNLGLTYASGGSTTPDSGRNIFCKHSQLASIVADWPNRDFHLKAGSPAIDAGLSLGYTLDVEGRTVPQGSAPDIGAFEYVQGAQISQWQVVALHGGADIVSSVAENYIEPRRQGVHRLLATFTAALDPATVDSGGVTIAGETSGDLSHLVSSVTLSGGNVLDIVLSGPLPDRQWCTMTVADTVQALSGQPLVGDRDLRLGTLIGDVNASGRVTMADVLSVRATAGQAAAAGAARQDVLGSGTVAANDMLEVHRHLGGQLP